MRLRSLSFALSFGAIVSVGCGSGNASTGSSARDAGAAAPARPVVIATPRLNPYPRLVVLHGQLEARESVELAARIEGPVDYVGVDLGDHVRAGKVLARIAATDFRAHVDQAEAQLTQARSDLARIDSLDHPEAISAQAREQAATAVTVANASLALARRQLVDTTVRAPFAGSVARREVSRGAFVRIGTPLFMIVSDGKLRLALSVPERYVREIGVGTKVSVLPEEATGDGFDATVVRVSPIIEQGSRTYRIEAEVDPHEGVLRPGMFVLGTIALGLDAQAVRIPRSAVFSVLGHDRVATVVDGHAALRDVELLGEVEGDAVVHGLSPSDVVVVRGGGTLAPETAVRIESTAPTRSGS